MGSALAAILASLLTAMAPKSVDGTGSAGAGLTEERPGASSSSMFNVVASVVVTIGICWSVGLGLFSLSNGSLWLK